MELLELKEKIKASLMRCQSIIESNPNAVLSEADFERLVCRCISENTSEDIMHPKDDDYSIHTQVSHYSDENDELNYRIDVLLLKESGLERCLKCRKHFKYAGDAFAIELKYLHAYESVRKVECDFCKRKHLEETTWLYVVVLIDSENNEVFEEKKKQIDEMRNYFIYQNGKYKNLLFSEVLYKKV